MLYLGNLSPKFCHFAWSKIIEAHRNELAAFAAFKFHTRIVKNTVHCETLWKICPLPTHQYNLSLFAFTNY